MSDPLDRLARRFEQDPRFLASVLAEHARAEGLDDAGLAQALGCAVGALPAVRLCRVPRTAPADFRADLREIADCFGPDAALLTAVVRQVESLRALREGAAAPGFLMAARDRDDEPPPEPEAGP